MFWKSPGIDANGEVALDIQVADISKIKSQLGWQPKVSFEEGVGKILRHIDYWKDAPVWTPDTIKEATQDWFKYLVK